MGFSISGPAFTGTYTGNVTITGKLTNTDDVTTASIAIISWLNRTKLRSLADGQMTVMNTGLTGFQALVLGPTVPSVIGTAPANGQVLSVLQASELLTIAAAATSTTTMLVPANAIVLAVSVRNTVAIPTAATYTVKLGATEFNTVAVPVAVNTTDAGTKAGAFFNATAQGVVITPDLTPATNAGRVRVTVSYLLVTPPTS